MREGLLGVRGGVLLEKEGRDIIDISLSLGTNNSISRGGGGSAKKNCTNSTQMICTPRRCKDTVMDMCE